MLNDIPAPWKGFLEKLDALLEEPARFDDLPEAMPRILAPGGLCHVITYEN